MSKYRFPTWLVTFALLLGSFLTAEAQLKVGWHFQHPYSGNPIDPGDVAGAGVYAQTHWNNHLGNGQSPADPLLNLTDDQGTPTTIKVSWTQSSNNSWFNGHNITPNERLCDGFIDQEPKIVIDQIPSSFTGPGYTVVVYYNNNEGPSTSTLKITGSIDDSLSRTVKTGDRNASAYRSVGFAEQVDGAVTSSTNYAVFTGLNDPKLTILLTASPNANNNGISAIQLIGTPLTAPPAVPALLTPADTAGNISVFSAFDWNDSAQAETYQIKVWRASDSEPANPTATVPGSNWTSPTPLEYSTNYRWKIIAVNGLGSTSSTTRTFTTETSQLPAAPITPAPVDGATDVRTDVSLTWQASARASAYDVYLWPAAQAQPATPTVTTAANAYTPPTKLTSLTGYQWKVVAKNPAGNTPGPVWSFTTKFDPVLIKIGWHFVHPSSGNTLGVDELAGVGDYAQTHWNNHLGNGQSPAAPLTGLLDGDGAATTTTVSWTQLTNNSWFNGHTATPNEKLCDGFIDQHPNIVIDQIPPTFTGPGYTVIVYYNNNEGPSTSDLKIVGSIDDSFLRTIKTGDRSGSAYRNVGFVEQIDGPVATSTNYAIFTGLNDPKLTISLTAQSGVNNNGISSIQLVAVSATAPPSVPNLLTPADSAGNVSVFPEFDWTDSAQAAFYQIKVWPASGSEPTDPTATSPVSNWIPELPFDYATTYRWKVIAVNTLGSVPSATRTFTTEVLQPPAAPTTPFPGNGSINVSPGVNLGWQQPARATSYDVYLWPTGQAQPATPTGTTSVNAYDPPVNLAPSASFQWKVVAKNSAGSASGPVWSFGTASDMLTISEFMAENTLTLTDEDNEYSDWIEIYNPGTAPVNLNGWYLTDKASNLTKWKFPAVMLPADSYLVVFASEKDRRNPDSELHTNFKLSADGEYLALVRPDGVSIAIEFAPLFPAQTADVSFGAVGNSTGYFNIPTPRGANFSISQSYVKPPQFSRASGLFTQSFQLALTPELPGDVVRYTINGAVPDASSPLYANPIPVTATTTVRAKSFRNGVGESDLGAGQYVKLESDALSFSSDLPLIVLDTAGKDVGAGTESTGFLTIIDKDPVTGRAKLTNPAQVATAAGLDVRGNTSINKAKKNYNVEFHTPAGSPVDYEVLGMPEESDWVLYGCSLDHEPTYFANHFIYSLARAMGYPAPRTRFVELFLNADGNGVTMSDYHGIYMMVERIKRGPDRVDIAKLTPQDNAEPAITGGYMLRFNQNDAKNASFTTTHGTLDYYTTFGFYEPKLPELTTAQRNWMIGYVNTFESALFGANFKDPATGYRAYFDDRSLMEYQLLEEFAANNDIYHASVYMSKDRGQKMRMSMLWDFDWAFTFRADPVAAGWRYNASEYNGAQRGMFRWYERLYQDPQYLQDYYDRWSEFRRTEFSTTALNARLDAIGVLLTEAAARDRVAFPGASLTQQISSMKAWLAARANWMDSQLGGLPPVISPNGGEIATGSQVTLSLPAGATGSIYYTKDGSDPRLSTPTALLYTGPITVNASTQIQARILNGSAWSPISSALFLVGEKLADSTNLAITEIMYHPDGTGVEFIELKNRGASPINLNGVYFADDNPFSKRFTFPRMTLQPGEFCIVTNDITAFQALYSNGPRIAGQFEGSLDNGGERITLKKADGTIILDFVFGTTDPWPVEADGGGKSLEAIVLDPALYNNASNWRASAQDGGSPGTTGPNSDADNDGVSDTIELAFGSNPNDPRSRPAAPTLARNLSTGAVTLTWKSQASRTYTVQFRNNLTHAWQDLDTVTATGATATYTDTGASALTARFYRIATDL